MTTSSAKAKGRRLQQLVAKALLHIGQEYDLEADDIKSTGMGQSGMDVQLSPAARRVLGNLAVEAKNVEKLNIDKTYHTHAAKYPAHVPMLVHKRNGTVPTVTVPMPYFMSLLQDSVDMKHLRGGISEG